MDEPIHVKFRAVKSVEIRMIVIEQKMLCQNYTLLLKLYLVHYQFQSKNKDSEKKIKTRKKTNGNWRF